MIRTIALISTTLLLLGATATLVGFAQLEEQNVQCTALEVDVEEIDGMFFVDAAGVKDAIFALGAALDGAAAAVVHQLHAVADAEDREPHLEDLGVVLGRVVRVHGRAAARDDERGVAVPAQVLGGCVEGQQLALDLELAEAAVDHLAVLRAGVEDADLLGGLLRRGGGPHRLGRRRDGVACARRVDRVVQCRFGELVAVDVGLA